jgi:hypothetical protein
VSKQENKSLLNEILKLKCYYEANVITNLTTRGKRVRVLTPSNAP